MNLSFADPLIIICAAILLIGLVFLVWAFGKLFKKTAAPDELSAMVDEYTPLEPEAPADLPFRAPERSPAPPPPSTVNPVATKEVSDRLELMAQRLADMQSVLNKQTVGTSAGGATGQGFSPETIDKLLKIIGNVIQQVDVLQKSLTSKPAASPAAHAAPAAPPSPAAPAAPAPAPTPAARPPAAPPGGIAGSSGLRGGGGPITGPQSTPKP